MIAHADAAFRKGVEADQLPPIPWELEPLWGHYLTMARRRQIGMAANPLLVSEIEAYERKFLVTFTAWETGLLCRLDDTVVSAFGQRAKPPPKAGDPIPVTDGGNMKAMLRGIASRKRAEIQQQKPGG